MNVEGIEITQATSTAQLTGLAPIEKMAATLGYNVIIFLAFVGAAVIAFVFLYGCWNLFGKRLVGSLPIVGRWVKK